MLHGLNEKRITKPLGMQEIECNDREISSLKFFCPLRSILQKPQTYVLLQRLIAIK